MRGMMASQGDSKAGSIPTTSALTPANASTKRLSTFKPSSPTRSKAALPGNAGVKEVVSPGELCGFVDTLLAQLEGRFDEMSEQVMGRMNEMSTRIDNLETTIQDLMTGDIDVASPAPAAAASASGSTSMSTPTPAAKR